MKIYLNLRLVFVFCMVLSLILAHPLAVFADVKDLMISTDSNALMTLELDDSDYLLMSPRSSVGTVENTVDKVSFSIFVTNGTYTNSFNYTLTPSGGRFSIPQFSMPDYYDGYWISRFLIFVQDDNFSSLPRPLGNYLFSMDLSSDFSYELSRSITWFSSYKYDNSVYDQKHINLGSYSFASGDVYIPPIALNIKSGYTFNRLDFNVTTASHLVNMGGTFALRFDPTDETGLSLAGPDSSSSALYEDSVSSSLSDLSSSVGEMSDEISGVTEAIQNLQGAMEPHYNNVLTQLHHITEQLHAFWDQIYNMFYLPQYARLGEILNAIQNVDLEVEVNLNSLKSSIDTMSQAVQNKVQSATDTITGGYDNSSMESDQQKLDDALAEYDAAEKEVLGGATEHISGFEFDDSLSQFSEPLTDISYFLGALFTSMGVMNVIVSFSLTLTIAMCMIGWYRFKGGK